MDLFFFDTEGTQSLDAYQRVAFTPELPIHALSTRGPRRLIALADSSAQRDSWYQLHNYGDLRKHRFSLEADSAEHPLLWGEALLEDDAEREIRLRLRPMLCRISLRSISADFSRFPYAGEHFFNRSIFLAYAGSECFPLAPPGENLASWMNPGEVDSSSVFRLPHPEYLLQEGLGDIGPQSVEVNRSFYCYPSPQTSLVLEGTVGDDHCYYPLHLKELEPGQNYELKLTLLRKGAPDALSPVESGAVAVEPATLPWDWTDMQYTDIHL